ncbi:zinc ABC transporter substrate-binding protein [Yoonia litorea]|uniref:High-affinity zinc uptake system protein ZnuA n=1 Tax=Yoonia litorea TaxID=1123755 RepID=A0A1I6LGK0_9RHOB|nr:zinc ABC transporter substrate-binding protein [Yoonia litorea]SFS02523.1 zinc transport system substrate-binding protein [Yoonia litorea]
MIRFALPVCLLPLPALADVPRVMTDIAPIHSLTAQVMGDLGTPDVLLPPGADPHDFALRPSDAQALGDADIVFWVGEGLTPWLAEPLETLAGSAAHISLLETEGWTQLDIREAGDHGHGHGDHGHDDHDHDHDAHQNDDGHNHDHGHNDHGHDDHAHDDHGHDDDKHDHGHGHAHDHGDFDPHAWTDPQVAQIWLAAIAAELSAADPENAATYAENAKAAVAGLAALDAEIAASMEGLSDRAYVLPHDGYQYFEVRYGLTAQASISGSDARTPGPAQIAEIREELSESNVVCVFSDAEIGDRWANLIIEGTEVRTAQIDAVGVGLDAGPDLYSDMMMRLANQFVTCLSGDK